MSLEEAEVCAICLDDLPGADHEVARATRQTQCLARTTPCGHYYHDFCIKSWAERANSCPKCRSVFNLIEVVSNGSILDKIKVEDKKLPVEFNAEDFEIPIDDYEYDQEDGDWVPHATRFTMCILCDQRCTSRTGMAVCADCSGSFHLNCLGMLGSGSTHWNCPMCDSLQDSQTITPSRGTRAVTLRTNRRSRGGSRVSEVTGQVPQRSSFIQSLRREIRNNRYTNLGLPVPSRNTRGSRRRSGFAVGQPLSDDATSADFDAVVDATRRFREQSAVQTEQKLTQEEKESWNMWERVKKGETSRSTTPIPNDERKFKKPNRKRALQPKAPDIRASIMSPSVSASENGMTLLEKQLIQKLFIREKLKRRFNDGQLDTMQYTAVNKNVSRTLYQIYLDDNDFQRYIRGLIELRERLEARDLNEFLRSQQKDDVLMAKYGQLISDEIAREIAQMKG
ncbi:unnamed protein product [Kuraishia capsulata CBS 1993]|uniref:RING-type domain-containing protein n=1 Tax=Kuraishia capsulata CBS 1993 TaxID=1382522 RepID=W6MM31_9ASCO|nr:uncharacterized protein KUCA_T00001928001 [Kuraishia capsulata CBS 1993]CDK25957.1 unnamed protein product [Kuraishia capsulata CBS 1993]